MEQSNGKIGVFFGFLGGAYLLGKTLFGTPDAAEEMQKQDTKPSVVQKVDQHKKERLVSDMSDAELQKIVDANNNKLDQHAKDVKERADKINAEEAKHYNQELIASIKEASKPVDKKAEAEAKAKAKAQDKAEQKAAQDKEKAEQKAIKDKEKQEKKEEEKKKKLNSGDVTFDGSSDDAGTGAVDDNKDNVPKQHKTSTAKQETPKTPKESKQQDPVRLTPHEEQRNREETTNHNFPNANRIDPYTLTE